MREQNVAMFNQACIVRPAMRQAVAHDCRNFGRDTRPLTRPRDDAQQTAHADLLRESNFAVDIGSPPRIRPLDHDLIQTHTWQISAGSLTLPVNSPIVVETNFTSYSGWESSHSLIV